VAIVEHGRVPIATSPLRPLSPPRQPREDPTLPVSPSKRTARLTRNPTPSCNPTPSSPPKAAITVADVLKMTEAEVAAMETAPPLPSCWEDDELSADEDLDTGCPRVLATHHRRDAPADASPPRSP